MPQTVSGEGFREYIIESFYECESIAQVRKIRRPTSKSHAIVANEASTVAVIYKFIEGNSDADDSDTTLTPDYVESSNDGRWKKIPFATTIGGGGSSSAVINEGGVNSFEGDLFANRPAASTAGNVYIATDTGAIYYDNGSSWVELTADTSTLVANAGNSPSIEADVVANRPAAGTAGAVFIATDEKKIYRDNGSSWDLIGISDSGVTFTGPASLKKYLVQQETITNNPTTILDFDLPSTQLMTISQNTTFTTSNITQGSETKILITADGSGPYTLTFPAGWIWIGPTPTDIAASKHAVLTLTATGTTDASIWAAYCAEE